MITLRQITNGDLPDLCELYNELMGVNTNYQKVQSRFNSIRNNTNYIILGAFHNQELLGSLMGIVCYDLVGECKPFMVIENVIVSSKSRRQGVGRKLFHEIECIAKDRECAYIILVSGEQRKEAHQFYEQLGFKDEKVEGYRKHLD